MQKQDDPDFYYLAGLIATDGYLRPKSYNVEINLSQFDDSSVDLLKGVASKFGGVVNYWGQKSPAVNWTITNMDYYNYLLSIGITNKNKSFDLNVTNWFNNLKEEYRCAFLRGCLDGDGSVYLRPVPKTQKRPFLLSVSITSASKAFIEMMSKSVKGNIHYPKNKKYMTINIYALAAQTLLDKLYGEGTGNLKLDRKFERFAKFKQQCIPY